MHSHSQRSAIAYWSKQIAAIASCTALLTGLLLTHTALTARRVDAAVDRPTLQGDAPVDTSVVRLEIHLNRHQAILYQGSTPIKRYPIGTGRHGWETPVGTFQVMQMKRNPIWISPFTNERIAANDPRNPLRGYWIGFWTNGKNWIGFHGTLNASSVGKADSHGCIHMHDKDLQELFSQVSLGTQIRVLP